MKHVGYAIQVPNGNVAQNIFPNRGEASNVCRNNNLPETCIVRAFIEDSIPTDVTNKLEPNTEVT